MTQGKRFSYNIDFAGLPTRLPVFPLSGVLLLPGGQLPLNIFEPRYLDMINDALAADRLIGMIQPKNGNDNDPLLYEIGCAGKIISFEELEDGRLLVNLSGICRFRCGDEVETGREYRVFDVDWSEFKNDFDKPQSFEFDRDKLKCLLSRYFDHEGLSCSDEAIDEASDEKIVTCLSMICPLEAGEKQALLEAKGIKERAEMVMTMLDLAVRGNCKCDGSKN